MSSFFLKKGAKGPSRKRKNDDPPKGASSKGKKKPSKFEDEEIPSDEDVDPQPDLDGDLDNGYASENDDNKESAEEKRLRLAKAYLEEIEREEKERAKDSDSIHDAVNQRLRKDNLEETGKLKQEVALSYLPVNKENIQYHKDKRQKSSITCVVVSPDGSKFYSGSKDAGLLVWDLKTGEKLAKLTGGRKGTAAEHKGHCSTINCMAISSDGKFLASGDDDKLVHIWNAENLEPIHKFKGHKDSVTGLAFRQRTHTLYSCSADRSVKIWNLDEMAYVETLFGHQDRVTGIDSGLRERAITSGGRDGSVRIWKIVDESQLVFNGPASSTDAVKLINEEQFVTAGEDGHISLWTVMKKKPLCTIRDAHGKDPVSDTANWVSAITTLPMSDLIATGSCDGYIRLWRCSNNFRNIEPLQTIPMTGFVNSLAFSSDGKNLVAGIGQEHRLGRWIRIKEAKNRIAVIPLQKRDV